MEHSGKLACVNQARSIWTIGFRLHGVECGSRTEGQEVRQAGLVLLKTPLPDVGGRTGDSERRPAQGRKRRRQDPCRAHPAGLQQDPLI